MRLIFWMVGDKSGDLHAANVIAHFQTIAPHVEHVGIGGPQMRQKGFRPLLPFERFNIMGFGEVVKHLPFFYKTEKMIKSYLAENEPDLVVLVDYPGFNFRIANIAYNLHIKILYYIIPQFWAWRHNRIFQLRQFCDYIACIFPFEKELLDIHGIESSYVGHPIVEEVNIQIDKKEFAKFFALDPEKKWISFFPGSRLSEIKRLLPVYAKTIKKLRNERPDCEFLVSKTRNIPSEVFNNFLKEIKYARVIDGYTYEMMKYSDFLIVKSGTTTVEAAYIGTPFAVVYKTSSLSYKIARKYVRVSYIAMPNIILYKDIIPELIQDDVTPEKLIDTITLYLENQKEYQQMSADLTGLKEHLGTLSASKNVADKMIELINK